LRDIALLKNAFYTPEGCSTSYTIFPHFCHTYFNPHRPDIKALGKIGARLVAASGKIAIVLPAQP
jgi:hypothetical protein